MLLTLQNLQTRYDQLGIPTNSPGFYDHPNFIAEERRDPSFLQTYYQFVLQRTYTDQEIQHARQVVPQVAEFLSGHLSKLERKQRFGRCIDMGLVVSRFLEREGVWNAVVKGVVRIDFDSSGKHAKFGPIGPQSTGHAWVFAPPFKVVDVTLAQQAYDAAHINKAKNIPKAIVVEKVDVGIVSPTDFFAPPNERALRQRLGRPILMSDVDAIQPEYRQALMDYPVVKFESNGLKFMYAPLSSSVPDAPFEELTNIRLNNKLAHELYNDYSLAQI